MLYQVEFKSRAIKFLSSVPPCDKERILDRIKDLSENPRNDHVKKLHDGECADYRARQGDYRIFFNINDDVLIVEVIDIKTRQNSYKK